MLSFCSLFEVKRFEKEEVPVLKKYGWNESLEVLSKGGFQLVGEMMLYFTKILKS